MPDFRASLPQLAGELFLTDGGAETSLIYDQGLDLPYFAAYVLLESDDGRQALRDYLQPYLDTARARGLGFIIETPTWRANADWGEMLGHDAADLDGLNRVAVIEAEDARERCGIDAPVVISGQIGPRGDGYDAGETMTVDDATAYHRPQIATFADTTADMVTALTMTNVEEAIGIATAAGALGIPVVIGFTVETDALLPSGSTLQDAIVEVDAATDGVVAYYMINCAHPTHFADVLAPAEPWTARIRSIRANASARIHTELDEATELDSGDPDDLAAHYRSLRDVLPQLNVVGGCCGTDHRHIAAIAAALVGEHGD